MSTRLGHDRGIRRAIATVCLSGMLEDKLDAVAGAGFDGVEIFGNDLIASSSTPAEVRKRCADLGLSIDLYQPFRDFDTRCRNPSTSPSRPLTFSPPRASCGIAGRHCSPCRTTTTRTFTLASRFTPVSSTPCASSGFSTIERKAASSTTSIRPSTVRACSLRWSRGSARMCRTERRIRPSACRRRDAKERIGSRKQRLT